MSEEIKEKTIGEQTPEAAAETPNAAEITELQNAPEEKKKNSKLITSILVAVIILGIIALISIVTLLLNGGFTTGTNLSSAFSDSITIKKDIYSVSASGQVFKNKNEIEEAYISADGAFALADRDGKIVRIDNSDGKIDEIIDESKADAVFISDNYEFLAYSEQKDDANELSVMNLVTKDVTNVQTRHDVSYNICYLSDDGQFCVWSETDLNTFKTDLYSSENGSVDKIASDYEGYYPVCYVSTDHKVAVISWQDDKDRVIIIKQSGVDAEKVVITADNIYGVYSKKGILYQYDAENVSDLYIVTQDKLWSIALDGEKYVVMSGLGKYDRVEISSGYLVVNHHDQIKYVKFNEDADMEENMKPVPVYDFDYYFLYGKYIYIEEGNSLYCGVLGSKKYPLVTYRYNGEFLHDAEGGTLIYCTDTGSIDDGKNTHSTGDLYKWNYFIGKNVKLGENVDVESLCTGLEYGGIDPNNFSYLKFVSDTDDFEDKDAEITAQIMHKAFFGSSVLETIAVR